ncbi:MAG TPA: exopolyphosphatase [Actinomycetota bacterium]|nr:exopolyphosphatase [Actinomycetota bacterium]
MTRLAAIDVGTNTTRLLVCDVQSSLVPVARDLEVTRLGEGVDASARLDPEALARTVRRIASYAERARDLGATRVRVAATSAARDAANRDELCAAVSSETGLELEILDGADEGRLTFLGATLGLGEGPFCVVDIGGGSTEFVRGTVEAEAVISVDVGSVRLRERCLTSDPPTQGEIGGARAVVDAALVEAERHVGLVGDETLVGVAGTVTTLTALVAGLQSYDASLVHHARLAVRDVREWTQRLLSLPVADIRPLAAVHPGRADVIAAGALIWERIMDRWGFEEALVSETDILDGLVADMAGVSGGEEIDAFG